MNRGGCYILGAAARRIQTQPTGRVVGWSDGWVAEQKWTGRGQQGKEEEEEELTLNVTFMMNRKVLQLGGCERVSVLSEHLFEIVRAKLWEGNGRG